MNKNLYTFSQSVISSRISFCFLRGVIQQIILRHLCMYFFISRLVVLDRWLYDENKTIFELLKIPKFAAWLVRKLLISKQTHAQGMGRHSEEEVVHIARLDLEAISNYIGE